MFSMSTETDWYFCIANDSEDKISLQFWGHEAENTMVPLRE